jgi:hypothetical protein
MHSPHWPATHTTHSSHAPKWVATAHAAHAPHSSKWTTPHATHAAKEAGKGIAATHSTTPKELRGDGRDQQMQEVHSSGGNSGAYD